MQAVVDHQLPADAFPAMLLQCPNPVLRIVFSYLTNLLLVVPVIGLATYLHTSRTKIAKDIWDWAPIATLPYIVKNPYSRYSRLGAYLVGKVGNPHDQTFFLPSCQPRCRPGRPIYTDSMSGR